MPELSCKEVRSGVVDVIARAFYKFGFAPYKKFSRMRAFVSPPFGFFVFMRKLNFLALLISFYVTLYGQSGTDLRVLNEDSRSLVVEFVPVFVNKTVTGSDGVEY